MAKERKRALRDLLNEILPLHRPLISHFWCSVEPKVATVTVTAATAVGTVGVARDDDGGKCDGSQVLISAFRRDARDSKRRKNGWDVAEQEQGKPGERKSLSTSGTIAYKMSTDFDRTMIRLSWRDD